MRCPKRDKRSELADKYCCHGCVLSDRTGRIFSSLKAGVIPWEEPWKAPRFAGGPFPRNFYTGKPYGGINALLLWSSEYSSPFWLTLKQAQALKGNVRRGQHGTPLVFCKQLPEYTKKARARMSAFLSFSATTRCSTWSSATASSFPKSNSPRPHRRSTKTNSPTEYRAYYRPSTASVHMPARSRFMDAPHYYSPYFTN